MRDWESALDWEKWRSIRLPLAVLCLPPLLLGGLACLYWHSGNASFARACQEMCGSFQVIDGMILILFLLFVHGQRGDLHLGLDVTHFKLPVRSSRLALAHLRFGFLALAGYSFVSLSPILLLVLTGQPLGPRLAEVAHGPVFVRALSTFAAAAGGLALHLMPYYLCAQAVCWWLGPASTAGAIIAVAGSSLTLAYLGFGLLLKYHFAAFLTLMGGVSLLSALLCIVAVRLQRTGVLTTATLRGLLQSVMRNPGAAGSEFENAEQAHRWYEWRRKGRLFPLVFTVIAVANLALALISPGTFCGLWGEPWGNSFRLGDSPIPYFAFMLEQTQFLLFMCALPIGLIVSAFAYREYVSGVAVFHFTKPVSTKELARSYGWVSTRACLVSGAVLVIALSPSVFLWTPELPNWAIGLGLSQGGGWASCLALGALWGITLLGVFIVTWMALTLGFLLLGYLVPIALIVLLVELVFGPSAARDAYVFLQGACILLAAISSGAVTYAASRRRILDRKDIVRFIAAWPLIAIGLVISQARTVGLSLDASPVISIIFTALLAPLVTLPFALWSLIIDWQRHR